MSPLARAASLAGCILVTGCQLVLGFEEHTLLVGGAGGSGGGPQGGAPVGGAPTGFGDPEEVASGLGPLDAVAVAGEDVFVLEQAFGAFQIQRLRGADLQVVVNDLPLARGLATSGTEVLTSHAPLDQFDSQCHVTAFGSSGDRDVMRDFCDEGENAFFAIAVDGDTLAASFLSLQGADHSDVRVTPVASSGNTGMLIGLGEDEEEPVPSIAIANGVFFWVDSQLDDVMTSTGDVVQNFNDPPGDSVNTMAEGLTTLTEVVAIGNKVYIARESQVAALSPNGDAEKLEDADSPRGLAADSAIVVWAEDGKVRAHVIDTGETMTLDEPDDDPTDVALSPSFVAYVTAGGRIVQIPRM